MSTSPTAIGDIIDGLMVLPDDPTTEQIQRVLSDDVALALMADATDDSPQVTIMGYVMNHQRHFGTAVVQRAEEIGAALKAAAPAAGGSYSATFSLADTDEDGIQVGAPGDTDEFAHYLRLFVPGSQITRVPIETPNET